MSGIAITITQYPPVVGGAEKKAQRLAARFGDMGRQVLVLTRCGAKTDAIGSSRNVTTMRFGARWLANAVFYLKTAGSLLRLRRDYDVIHNFMFSSLSIVSCIMGKLLSKPVFISVGGTGDYGGIRDTTGMGRLQSVKLWIILKLKPVFICPSLQSRRELVEFGIPPERAAYIPNPVDADVFTIPNEAGKNALREVLGMRGMTFLFLGRLAPVKAIWRILKAWPAVRASIADARLIIAGGGPEEAALRKAVGESGMSDHVTMTGEISNALDYYRAADFFVLSSKSEGMSNALLEAMACGLVPIVTDVSGTESVVDGRTGFKLPNTDDPSVFSRALIAAAQLTADERAAIGRRARAAIEITCSLNVVAQGLLDLYARIALQGR